MDDNFFANLWPCIPSFFFITKLVVTNKEHSLLSLKSTSFFFLTQFTRSKMNDWGEAHRCVGEQTAALQLCGKRWEGWEWEFGSRAFEPSERVTETLSASPVCVFTAQFCLWVIWNISGISPAAAWRKDPLNKLWVIKSSICMHSYL